MSIFQSAILYTLKLIGAEQISHSGRVIRCTYNGADHVLRFSMAGEAGTVATPCEAMIQIGAMQAQRSTVVDRFAAAAD